MNGGDADLQIQSPHPAAADLKTFSAPTFPGIDIKNSQQNHPTFAESNTSSPTPAKNAEPTKPEYFATAERNELYVVQPVAVTLLPPADVQRVGKGEYHPGYIDEMLRFFDRPKMREIIDTYTWKSGAISEKIRYVPNTPPHFSEFARKIGVTTRRLKMWCREHPAFKDAYDQCQEILEEFLIDNGLVGAYGAIAMKFVAVNRSKMKDKSVQENHTININEVLDGIAAGRIKPGGEMELSQGDE